MDRLSFSSARPLDILNFFSTFKKAQSGDQIPKEVALEILDNFMNHGAHRLYCLLMDENGEELGGFRT